MKNKFEKMNRLINQNRCPRCAEDFCVKHEVSKEQQRVSASLLCLKCYNQISKLRKDLLIIDIENGLHEENVENNIEKLKRFNENN